MPPNIMYLHGFASSPNGAKASFLADRLALRGLSFYRPDLNVPAFEQLTITAMIEKAAQAVGECPPGPVYLIGSSLGGFVSLHLLDRQRQTRTAQAAARVEKLILLAPAFDFASRYRQVVGEEGMAQWQKQGWLPVMHHAYQEERRLHYGLVEDAGGYSSGLDIALDIPVLILHGRQDETVPYTLSEQYAAGHPGVTLRLLDADHSLANQHDRLWRELYAFFDLK